MKKYSRHMIAILCMAAVLFPATSCSLLEQFAKTEPEETTSADTALDDVLALVDEYAKAVEYRDTGKLATFSDGVEDEDLEFLELSGRDADDIQIIEDIADTITCIVDEDTISASSEDQKGTAKIVVMMADYEPVLASSDNLADIDTLESAITAAQTREITITLDLILKDESWLVTNFDDIREDVYGFYDLQIDIIPSETIEETSASQTDISDQTVWFDTYSDHLYVNTESIQISLVLGNDVDSSIRNGINYTLEYNGATVLEGEGTNVVYDNTVGECDTTYPECLAAGIYTVTFYAPDGSILYTDSVTVTTETRHEITAADVEGASWYDTDDGIVDASESAVYTNTGSLDLVLSYDQAMCDISGVYYVVTLGGDAVYTSPTGEIHCTYGTDDNAEADHDMNMVRGDYTVTFFNGSGELIASATCTVRIE